MKTEPGTEPGTLSALQEKSHLTRFAFPLSALQEKSHLTRFAFLDPFCVSKHPLVKIKHMAAEPIVIFSNKIDPAGVLKLLRSHVPNLQVEGPDNDWTRITISQPKKLLRRRGHSALGMIETITPVPTGRGRCRACRDTFPASRQTGIPIGSCC